MPINGPVKPKPVEPASTFGSRIRQLRKEKGLSQRIVAEALDTELKKQGHRGLDVTYLSKIENERLPAPSPGVILALADLYEVDARQLLELAGRIVSGIEGKLLGKPLAREFVEFAIDRLSEDDWKKLLLRVKRRN